jgi:hypothetical protein
MSEAADIVLLGAEWQPRALIRAQLIEEGFEVVATDSWEMMRRHLRPGSKPRLAIVDLQGLPNPLDVLEGLRLLMKPQHVLVLTAIGTVSRADIERLGFVAVPRPIVVSDVMNAVAQNMPS